MCIFTGVCDAGAFLNMLADSIKEFQSEPPRRQTRSLMLRQAHGARKKGSLVSKNPMFLFP